MLTPIIALFARWGLPERLRRPLALIALAVAVIALLVALWTLTAPIRALSDWLSRRAAVENANNAANAEFRARQLETERHAGAAKAGRDRLDSAKQDHLEDLVDEADDAGSSAADDVWHGGLFDQPAR